MKIWPIFLTLLHFILVLVWIYTKNPFVVYKNKDVVNILNMVGILFCLILWILKLVSHIQVPWIFGLLSSMVVIILCLNFWLISFQCDKTKDVSVKSKGSMVLFSISWTLGITGMLVFFLSFVKYLHSSEWKDLKKKLQDSKEKQRIKKQKKDQLRKLDGDVQLEKLNNEKEPQSGAI